MECREHNFEEAAQLFDNAFNLYVEYEYQQAIDILLHLREYHCDSIHLWNIDEYLGLSYYYLDIYHKAEEYLRMALDKIGIDPDYALDRLIIIDNLGCTYYRLYRYDEALEYFHEAEKMIDLYKGDEWEIAKYLFYMMMGRCYLMTGQSQEAYDSFMIGYEIICSAEAYVDSSARDTLGFEIGRALYHLKRFEEAERYLRSVDPETLDEANRALLAYNLFKTYVSMDKFQDALVEYDRLKSLGMKFVDQSEAYYILGIMYFKQGLHEKARRYFEKALSIPTVREWVHKDAREYLKDIDAAN